MKQLRTIIKNELLRYFISPVAYIYLISFLLLNGAMAFYFGHIFERGQASLFYMFSYQPWLYLLFVTGISMRLWAEEFKSKTIVQIMTLPVKPSTFVWGKFFASWLFCALALVLTFPFWATVNILGQADNAVIALGYLASFTLAGAMLAVSQTMSALTKNQVIALVLAVIANLFFFWSGIEFVLAFFRLFMPDYLIDTIASFSFLTHFANLTGGLLELKDVIFFASIILLFNFTTTLIVEFKTAGTSSFLRSANRSYYITAWLMLLTLFTGLNLSVNNLTRGYQADFTSDNLYTLDKDTVQVLQNLPEDVTAKLYFSNILQKRNPLLRQMFDKIRLLLEQYKTASNGKFDYRIYHPENLDNIEDRAIADGLQPIPLIDINQNALFGLTLTDTLEHKEVIPYLTAEQMPYLEQTLTTLIYRLNHPKKTVGLLSSLPIFGQSTEENMMSQPWEISRQISQFYNVKNILKPEDLEDIDVLLIIHPQGFSPEMVEKIKSYSQNYGNILLLLDGATEATRLYSPVSKPYTPSDLSGLEKFWGFGFYPKYVVADLENSTTVDATSNYKNNPAYTQDIIQFKLKSKNFNPNHPVTKHLQSLLASSASVIYPLSGAQTDFVPLAQASQNSSVMDINVVYKGLNPREILSYFKKDDAPKILSAYIHGLEPNNQFNLIVFTDTDFIYDNFWTSPHMVLERTYFTPLFTTADFVLNALDFLVNDTSLLSLRGKSAKDRSFTNIENLRKNSIYEFKLKEEEIFKRIETVKSQLQEIWGKRTFEERETFTADELALISSIRKKLDSLRQELSAIRLQTNHKINAIAFKIKFVNIFAVPLILLLLWLAVYIAHKPKNQKASQKFYINKALLKLIISAILVLLCGIASVYYANLSDIEKYEDKPLFPNLGKQINSISSITLQTHTQKLHFKLQDGVFKLAEQPLIPVYQERIRSFLSALLEAAFYEKKSDKAQNLAHFGLSPVEEEGSQNTRIELSDGKNIIQAFEVGRYNLDLGRGSKAAYVKFDNLFQVWMAEIDLIDLSADWHAWTYSDLWNLRFGRFESINASTEPDFLANSAKLLLNTPFIGAAETLQNAKELPVSIRILAENKADVLLKFYLAEHKYYVQYTFSDTADNKNLEFFKTSAKNAYFEINQSDWEQIDAHFR